MLVQKVKPFKNAILGSMSILTKMSIQVIEKIIRKLIGDETTMISFTLNEKYTSPDRLSIADKYPYFSRGLRMPQKTLQSLLWLTFSIYNSLALQGIYN